MSAPGFRQFDTLAVVGLGLIGGSFAMDVRRLGLAKRILGYDNNSEYRAEISSRNLVDYLAEAPDSKLAEAQLVMLAVPVKAFAEVLSNIRPHLSASVILTDTGSVKSPLLKMMRAPEYAGISFVGGHPIAGSENFGPRAAREIYFPVSVVSLLLKLTLIGMLSAQFVKCGNQWVRWYQKWMLKIMTRCLLQSVIYHIFWLMQAFRQ